LKPAIDKNCQFPSWRSASISGYTCYWLNYYDFSNKNNEFSTTSQIIEDSLYLNLTVGMAT